MHQALTCIGLGSKMREELVGNENLLHRIIKVFGDQWVSHTCLKPGGGESDGLQLFMGCFFSSVELFQSLFLFPTHRAKG